MTAAVGKLRDSERAAQMGFQAFRGRNLGVF